MNVELITVILYSYRRPEMTKKAIQDITEWPRLGRLYVSIDGERSNCSDEERFWRKQVIDVAEVAAEKNSKIHPVIWNDNLGLTDHSLRIMRKALGQARSFIAVEEDNSIQNPGLDFLADGLATSSGPFISTAYTSSPHHSSNISYRSTFFPEQWTTALNSEVFEAFEKVWRDKVIKRDVVMANFSSVFRTNPLYARIVAEKWLRIFSKSAVVPSHGDALMTYAALSLNTPYSVPMNSFVADLGSSDQRGMNPRGSVKILPQHSPIILKIGDQNFCKTCEYSTNGVRGMGLFQTAKTLSRRAFGKT
jgi:hypothetical protein